MKAYEDFVDAYARAMADFPHGPPRLGAVRDGLADFYVSAGQVEENGKRCSSVATTRIATMSRSRCRRAARSWQRDP
ncbi:MAG: hypothetical protein QM736_14660 [Vicinamibacterales bacterium]